MDMSLVLTSPSNFLRKPTRDRDLFYESFKRLSEKRIWELSKFSSYDAEGIEFESGQVHTQVKFKREILRSNGQLASCKQIEKVYDKSLATWELFLDKIGRLQAALGGRKEKSLLEEFQDLLQEFEQSELRKYEDEIVTQVYSADLNKVFDLPNYFSDTSIARTLPSDLEMIAFHFDGFQKEANDFGIDLPHGISFDIDSDFVLTLSRQASLFSGCLDGWHVRAVFHLKVYEHFSHLGQVLHCPKKSASGSLSSLEHSAYPAYERVGTKGYNCNGVSSSTASYHCDNNHLKDDKDLPASLLPAFACQWVEGWESGGHERDYRFEVSFKAR